MSKNGRLEIVAAGMLLAYSPFSPRAQQLPATAPTRGIAAEGADAATAVVLPPPRNPKPPHVSCLGDQLTIKADYSLLSSVLDAVHACIGVNIALPEGFVDGPVFFELGPGRTREVLNSLLNASDLDFVILLSPSAPEKVVTVELMARSTGLRDANTPPTPSGAMTPGRLAWLAARNLGRGVPPAEGSTVEPVSNDSVTASDASADHAEQSPPASTSPPPETRPGAAAVDAGVSTNPSASDTAGSINTPASDNATASSSGAVTTTAETPTAAAPTDPTAVTPADQQFQQKITDMQQLFEQRRRLNSTPAATTDSNAVPAPNPS
jgi:hypothetical protein